MSKNIRLFSYAEGSTEAVDTQGANMLQFIHLIEEGITELSALVELWRPISASVEQNQQTIINISNSITDITPSKQSAEKDLRALLATISSEASGQEAPRPEGKAKSPTAPLIPSGAELAAGKKDKIESLDKALENLGKQQAGAPPVEQEAPVPPAGPEVTAQ